LKANQSAADAKYAMLTTRATAASKERSISRLGRLAPSRLVAQNSAESTPPINGGALTHGSG
jgi:hypothetical protein